MRIGLVSMDHLRDWTGITVYIDEIASEMAMRGHDVVIIAKEGLKASYKVPASRREYPHTLLTLNLSDSDGRLAARESIQGGGLDVCLGMFGSTEGLYMPQLFKNRRMPYIIGEPASPIVYTYSRWQPYEHYATLADADVVQFQLAGFLPYYPKALQRKMTLIGQPAPSPHKVDFVERAAKQTRILIGVGRFHEYDKRFSLLLRAFALVSADFPDWRLKLVGDGPYWEYYHIMTEQLGITGKVIFTGSVADPGIHYADADLFCLPSSAYEGFGLVFGEAASWSLPLVGFASSIAASALIEPDAGALVEGDSPEALADALRPLMSATVSEREQMGKRARDSFQERYDACTVFDAWEKLLEDTAGGTIAEGGCEVDMSKEQNLRIGPEWDGLKPDSPVWSGELLDAAALEIAERDDPMVAPEASTAPADVENVRLRCELARLRQEYAILENRCASLTTQFQALAVKPGKSVKRKKR